LVSGVKDRLILKLFSIASGLRKGCKVSVQMPLMGFQYTVMDMVQRRAMPGEIVAVATMGSHGCSFCVVQRTNHWQSLFLS